MSLKSQIEAIIYAAAEPVTVEQIADVLREVAPELLAVETGHAPSPDETTTTVPAPARDPKAELKALKKDTADNLGDVVKAGVWTWAQICQGIQSTPVCKANQ